MDQALERANAPATDGRSEAVQGRTEKCRAEEAGQEKPPPFFSQLFSLFSPAKDLDLAVRMKEKTPNSDE